MRAAGARAYSALLPAPLATTRSPTAKPLDLRAEFRHLTRDVAPQNLRRRDASTVRPLPHEDVQAVQRGGTNADQHVVRVPAAALGRSP